MRLQETALLLGLLFTLPYGPLAPAGAGADDTQVAAPQSVFASREEALLRTKQVSTPPVHLTQRYVSMEGPTSIRSFQIETSPDSSRIWIRRYKVDVVDDERVGGEANEFLCHAWLMADSGVRDALSRQRGSRGGRDLSLFLTISQGFEDMQFPDGFAVAFDSLDVSRVGLLTMAVNNNYEEIDKEIRFRATIDYLDDFAAQELGVKPLKGFQLHAHQKREKGSLVHHHASGHAGHPSSSRTTTDHWKVPPGRQVVRSDVKPGTIESDGMIHFIKIHLHPYGESVTLIDKTTGEEVWTGAARNHTERAHLMGVDSYSSTSGIPIYKDRDYELITVYDNPTTATIDAMAVMRLYVHTADPEPAS